MIIVAGWLSVDPTERADFLHGCADVVAQARSAPGCLDFALSPDLVDDGRVNVLERWASEADLQRFRGAGPSDEQNAVIRNADVQEFRVGAAV